MQTESSTDSDLLINYSLQHQGFLEHAVWGGGGYWWAKRLGDPKCYHLHCHINLQVRILEGQMMTELKILRTVSSNLREHVSGSEH